MDRLLATEPVAAPFVGTAGLTNTGITKGRFHLGRHDRLLTRRREGRVLSSPSGSTLDTTHAKVSPRGKEPLWCGKSCLGCLWSLPRCRKRLNRRSWCSRVKVKRTICEPTRNHCRSPWTLSST